MPPPSPEDSGPGSPEAEATRIAPEDEPMGLADGGGTEGPPPKKRHQKRLQRLSHDARLANKRANQGEPEPREGGRWNPETRG